MFAVIVTLEAVPERSEDLVKALENNAAHSRMEESCLKWEWLRHLSQPNRFAIYELYTDHAAFEAHKNTEHFAEWKKATDTILVSKVADFYDLTGADSR